MTARYTTQSPLVKITQVINLRMMTCQASLHLRAILRDKPEGNEEKGSGEGQSSKQPPEPPDADAPDLILMRKKRRRRRMRRRMRRKRRERGAHCEEEEETEVDEAEEVESEPTKKRRKITEHQQRVYDAAMTRLPFTLAKEDL